MKLWLFSQTNSSPFHSTVFWTHNDPPTLTRCDETWLIKTELCESFSLDEVELSQVELEFSHVDLCSLLHPTGSVSFTVCFFSPSMTLQFVTHSSRKFTLFFIINKGVGTFLMKMRFSSRYYTPFKASAVPRFISPTSHNSRSDDQDHTGWKLFLLCSSDGSWRVGWCESSTV